MVVTFRLGVDMSPAWYTPEQATAALAKVTEEVNLLGYTRICPESLTALIDESQKWGWQPGVREAYQIVMHAFRALLEPIGGW